MNQTEWIKSLSQDADDQLLLRLVLDKQKQQAQGREAHTRFLDPRQRALVQRLLDGVSARDYGFFGGYEAAERTLLALWPSWQEQPEPPLTVLRLGYPAEAALTHRDILGAVMAQGLDRSCLGDILVGESSADVVLLMDNGDFLASGLTQAGRARVKAALVPPTELRVPEQSFQTLHSTVETCRLDSILTVALRLSREKAAALIRTGAVQVDHQERQKPDLRLSSGCVLSVRGYGKFRLETLGEPTRKGRLPVTILKYE